MIELRLRLFKGILCFCHVIFSSQSLAAISNRKSR
jgi:hypothetical protein